MSLSGTIQRVIATADRVTKRAGLQATLVHEPFDKTDSYVKPQYLDPINRQGIVEFVSKRIKLHNGQEIMASARITFLELVQGMTVRDRVTMPDGSMVFVQSVRGVLNPLTNAGYVTEVWVGKEGA